eukprot:157849-Chlamydomonas_euryale.AAC.4
MACTAIASCKKVVKIIYHGWLGLLWPVSCAGSGSNWLGMRVARLMVSSLSLSYRSWTRKGMPSWHTMMARMDSLKHSVLELAAVGTSNTAITFTATLPGQGLGSGTLETLPPHTQRHHRQYRGILPEIPHNLVCLGETGFCASLTTILKCGLLQVAAAATPTCACSFDIYEGISTFK